LAKDFKGQVVAIKEASGDLEQVMEILMEKPEGFSVLSGDDALAYPLTTLGGRGVISVIANAYPHEFSSMIKRALEGKYESALKIHYQLIPVIKAMFREGNPAGVKGFLSKQGIVENNLRLPLIPASEELMKEISGLVDTPVQL
jgi:4-hydroxy-tetrahydrodipicolinate synthase